jgi:predicted lactoylglutathione lyase
MQIHAVNVIVGGIPTDKRKKVHVKIVLVRAIDKVHALQKAAQGFSTHSNFDDYTFIYRNEFDDTDGPILWNFQTWERADFDDVQLLTGSEILERVIA